MAGHEGDRDKEVHDRQGDRTFRLEPVLDLRSLRGHRFLRARGHRHKHAHIQVHAQKIPYHRVPEETIVHHVGHNHHHTGHPDGTDTIQQPPELCHHGLRTAGGIPVATGRHPHLAIAACPR